MSKKYPKANEIWRAKGSKNNRPIRILGIYKSSWGDYVCFCYFVEKDLEVDNDSRGIKTFLKNYTYVGKAQVSVNDWFKVEE
ncbi:MAG: hypothetical protein NC124_02425 [Clostridium sp.]|nr:hypothetical protein [Clostridium sp.]